MKAGVANWQWLLRHDLRLMARGSRLYINRARALWTLLTLQILIGLPAAAVVWILSKHPVPANKVVESPLALIYFMLLAGYLFSSAIKAAVITLFDQGDMELLLCSPISLRTVFVVRLLRIAASSGLLVAVFLLPAVNVAAAMGHPRLLATYPVFASLLLTAASGAMLLTIGLVRWLGARVARLVAQLAVVFFGTVIFIVLELPSMLNHADAHQVWHWLQQLLAADGLLGEQSLLRYPLRAAWGEPLPFLVVVGMAGFVTAGVIWLLSRPFSHGVLLVRSVTDNSHQKRPPVRFYDSLERNLLIKEWRLIYRDPYLIARIFRQIVFLIPAGWILLFKQGPHGEAVHYWMLGGFVLFMALSLTSSLAWLTVCGEDAPVLLASAPISPGRIKVCKLLAALLPIWLVSVLFVIVLWHHSAYMGGSFTLVLVLATSTTAAMTVWLPWPGSRRDFSRRGLGSRPDWCRAILGLFMTGAWGFTYYFLAKQSTWACLFTIAAIVSLELARRLGSKLEQRLAY